VSGPAAPSFRSGGYFQEIRVPFDYPVHFARGLFAPGNPLLARVLDRLGEGRAHRAAVFLDQGVAAAWPDLAAAAVDYFHARPERLSLAGSPRVVPGGEACKDGWGPTQEAIAALAELHLDRQSFVIAVGGGAVLDMVGFAASVVHRGLRMVRVPTTTLAQNDAGIGVKTGINAQGQKNFLGTFAPPFAVLNDFDFLETLPFEHWIGGVAEAFKVAIIKDADFFGFLHDAAAALRNREAGPMEQAVIRCAELHLDHIREGDDPFEFGSARPLDFGHWAAHKLEVLSGHRVGHGFAVAVGIAVDTVYAARAGRLSAADRDRILGGFAAAGLPVWHPLLNRRAPDGSLAVLGGLDDFREHLGGRLTVTLPDGLGSRVEVHEMDRGLLEQSIGFLAERGGGAG
jgi:3-dehydroquinate synthase